MRNLMLLLLLVNLGLFAWYFWVQPQDAAMQGVRLPVDPGAPLLLVDEDGVVADDLATPLEDDGALLEDEPAADLAGGGGEPARQDDGPGEDAVPEEARAGLADGATAPAAASGEIATASCASLGPFDNEDLAQTVVGRLLQQGYTPELRSTGGQIRSGFWVYLPPFEDRDTAKATEARLRQRGVRDLFIVTGEENRNAISLGLYSTADRADQRAAEIGRLGFSPSVSERFRDATVYWVDFREKPGSNLQPESIGVLDTADLLPEKQEIPCDFRD